eukprot:13037785-Ditylum_brightwellii.AAC.1
MLTMKGIHHPKGNVHRLYLHRSKGGRGLTGVEDTHNCTQKFLLEFASAPKFTSPEVVDNHHHKCLCEKPLHG